MTAKPEHQARVQSAIAGFYDRQRKQALREAGLNEDGTPKAPRKPSDTPTEYQEQRVVCDWLRAHKVHYYAIPNGGSRRNPIEGARLRSIGVKPGVPDLCIISPVPRFPHSRGVYLEMKRTTGGRLSDEQAYWLELLRADGYHAHCAKGADDALNWLQGLGFGQ